MEKSEFLVCPRCGKGFEVGREEYMDPKKHGWPVNTGEVKDGVAVWKLLICAEATDEEIAAYKAVRKEVSGQRDGIVARGFGAEEADAGG